MCWHGSRSPLQGVSEICQPWGSFLLPIEAWGLLVDMHRSRILHCCFWGRGGCRELTFAASLTSPQRLQQKAGG